MAFRTWTIEIRADFDTKEKEMLLLNEMKLHLQQIAASCMLLADKRAPQIAFSTADMFVDPEKIELFIEGEYDEEILG